MWHWSYEALPELAGLPDEEKRRIWDLCVKRARRRRPAYWLAVIGYLAAGFAWVGFMASLMVGGDLVWQAAVFVAMMAGIPGLVALLVLALIQAPRIFIPLELPGRCRRCGYALRATPDRCSECGVVPGETPERTDRPPARRVP